MDKSSIHKTIRDKLTTGNIVNGVFVALIIILLINPSAKALLIRGLMQIGLFQPDVSRKAETTSAIYLPDVSLQGSEGTTVDLSTLKGKVIFINFWATWCPPCIAEMPSINGLYQKLKNNKNIVFIMVDADHDFGKSIPFIKKHGFQFPLYQADSTIPDNILGNSIPTTAIFDKSGKMVFHDEGAADYSNPKVMDYLLQLAK